MTKKTNAARLLDSLGVKYTLRQYPVDENDLSALAVARKIGMPPAQVFKTLVAAGDKNGILLACIPGSGELDLKTLARVSGNKRVELVPLKDVQKLTGYVRGGVSPLGTKKRYPVFLDASAEQWPEITISAGQRGCQLILKPADLVRAVGAQVSAIACMDGGEQDAADD